MIRKKCQKKSCHLTKEKLDVIRELDAKNTISIPFYSRKYNISSVIYTYITSEQWFMDFN